MATCARYSLAKVKGAWAFPLAAGTISISQTSGLDNGGLVDLIHFVPIEIKAAQRRSIVASRKDVMARRQIISDGIFARVRQATLPIAPSKQTRGIAPPRAQRSGNVFSRGLAGRVS